MNTFFRQFFIFIKRALCKPIYLLLLLLIPVIAIFVKSLPEKEVSSNIRTGIYFSDEDVYIKNLRELLTDHTSGFVFVEYDSEEAMILDVSSGTLDCAFSLPANFSKDYPIDKDSSPIQIYTSPATMFSNVTMEILFDNLIKVYAAPIVSNYFSENPEISENLSSDYSESISEIYQDYMTNNSVFTIVTNSTGNYQSTTEYISLFPLYQFIGLLIFTSSLFGLMNAFKDEDEKIYTRLNKRNRFKFYVMNIVSNLLPAACVGYITLLIYGTDQSTLKLAIHILVYIIICLLFALLYRIIFSNYRRYIAALPILLACTMLLSPIFIDLTEFLPVLKWISYLFAPTYF